MGVLGRGCSLLVLGLLGGSVACHRPPTKRLSVLQMSDPNAVGQLMSGFYPLEANSWRWTARQFSIVCSRRGTSEARSVSLELDYTSRNGS